MTGITISLLLPYCSVCVCALLFCHTENAFSCVRCFLTLTTADCAPSSLRLLLLDLARERLRKLPLPLRENFRNIGAAVAGAGAAASPSAVAADAVDGASAAGVAAAVLSAMITLCVE